VKKKFPLTRYYNWLIYSVINPKLNEILMKYARGRMADIGCGIKPYKDMASKIVSEHIGIDHADTFHAKTNVDLIGTVYNIPTADESFDTILCTDVLEHVEEPGAAIAEALRILKKGGYGIYTVPFYWHLHEEPRDFFRYTKYGLRYLFEKNGFEVVEIIALSGFWVTFGQQMAYYLTQFRNESRIHPLHWLLPPIIVLIEAIAFLLGKIDRSENFTIEYLIVVKRN